MNLSELALDLVRRARARLDDGRRAVEDKRWPDVLRFSQEAVELALKGLLRAMAVEAPKRHDVGPVLETVAERLPPELRRELPQLVRLSAELSTRRALAVYGDELAGRSASEIFRSPHEAMDYYGRAAGALTLVENALANAKKKSSVRRRPRALLS